MAILRWLCTELDMTLPSNDDQAKWFLKGMVWMAVILLVLILIVTFAHFKAFGG